MEFDSNTPRTERTIAGRKVQVIQPFAEGQPLTPALAAMLNQTLAENFSNNLRKRIENGKVDAEGNLTGEEFSDAEVQAIVDVYMSEYQPGVRTGGGGAPRVTDPVEKEARKIARAKVLEVVTGQGLKASDVDMGELTSQLFEANRDAFMAQGKKVVDALRKAAEASAGIDISGLSISAKTAEPAEA